MGEPRFRLVCSPSALRGAPAGWARAMLRDGEIALRSDEGVEAVDALAAELARPAILLLRAGRDGPGDAETVTAYAASLPLVWVADDFAPDSERWARDRAAMTLLVRSSGPLGDEERRRIDRFTAILSRQSE